MPSPTPAHQAFREKRAVEIASAPAFRGLVVGSREYGEMCAAAGVAVEHEVARLMGRIGMLNQMGGYQHHPRVASILERALDEAESQLAALLEGK